MIVYSSTPSGIGSLKAIEKGFLGALIAAEVEIYHRNIKPININKGKNEELQQRDGPSSRGVTAYASNHGSPPWSRLKDPWQKMRWEPRDSHALWERLQRMTVGSLNGSQAGHHRRWKNELEHEVFGQSPTR